MRPISQAKKLRHVRYDVRGPILVEAERLEAEGHKILKLNIGNTAPFGFEAPAEIMAGMIHHLPDSQGYSDSRGIYSARTAIAQSVTSRAAGGRISQGVALACGWQVDYRRGSTGSDSSANTANTASCTRQSGSPRTMRSTDSRPSAYSRIASERLVPRLRTRRRSRFFSAK